MRRLVFAGLAAILVAALVWFAADRGRSNLTARSHPIVSVTTPALEKAPPIPPPATRTAARRFLHAFLAYEVGAGGATTARAIHATAVPAFARELLADPPRAPGTDPGPARIASLHVDPVPGHLGLALISGAARRPTGPEPFAFVFARRDGRWLALAPGE